MEKCCDNVVSSELIGSGNEGNPLKVTYSEDQKQICISGFDQVKTMTKEDCEGTHLKAGDLQITDSNGEILGYIMIG